MLLSSSSTALAKSQSELGWPLADVFSAAVRFVRVDRGCKVTERDEAAAYILFECPDELGKPKPKAGALELFKVDKDGRERVRAQVTLSDDPRYVELRFLELLERKLRDERGLPPPPIAKPRPSPPDGGS